jgi:dTDP-4-amino-4,6-dideoxygalactose transaminase
MARVLQIAEDLNLDVIEDAACALGATYQGKPVGTFGRLGIFSFHPRKSITTGEGGAIVTNDDDLAAKCRCWRNHGQTIIDAKRDFVVAGLNYRMTEFQAAIGRVQMEKLDEILRNRRALVASYLERLADHPRLSLPAAPSEHTWQTFMVTLDDRIDRQTVVDRLAVRGIAAGAGSVAGHITGKYRQTSAVNPEDLPVSLRLAQQGLALPLFACLQFEDVEFCCFCLQAAVRDSGDRRSIKADRVPTAAK